MHMYLVIAFQNLGMFGVLFCVLLHRVVRIIKLLHHLELENFVIIKTARDAPEPFWVAQVMQSAL